MAGNEWIGGYLDAILDSGHTAGAAENISKRIGAGDETISAAKYFVNEVTGYDDAALYRTWVKASASKYPQERGNRMEYLCWRIWHISRKKKQLEWEDAQRMAREHIEHQRGQKMALEELNAEDLSEGEKESPRADFDAEDSESVRKPLPQAAPAQPKEKNLYMVLISLHGLVRGDNMELGLDSDTGGQVKYVVELARALALMPEVYRVDLLTRQICDPKVDWSYGEPTEMLTAEECGESGESSGAYIVRIPFGPKEEYIRKELLWPHIQEFVDGSLSHILNMAKVLGDQIGGGEPVWPHVIHGHYADAGDAASLLSGALNVPMILTGHSLGRNKLEQLLKGPDSKDKINQNYKIMRRIEAEELSLDAAELVITSTRQEIEEQWGLYDGFNVKTERVLRTRARRGMSCHGCYMPRMVVITPGMDFSNVIVQDASDVVENVDSIAFTNADASNAVPISSHPERPEPSIWNEVNRFFTNPHKPMILALSRPDPKKNIMKLLTAFGECRPLRELANLTLIMGNREDVDKLSGTTANVLTDALKAIDKYDLYGSVAYPKRHKQSEVPEIYRLAAKTKGVFINPALVEPFGLTLIEAAAHGLPMVATKNGGPVDIEKALHNGLLIDPHETKEISNALLRLVTDRNKWVECRRSGLKNIHRYSWPEHCRIYLAKIAKCRMRHPQWQSGTDADGDDDDDGDSQGDSLRDLKDMSLRLSLDGTNKEDIEKLLSSQGSVGKDASANHQHKETKLSSYASTAAGHSRVSTLRKRKKLVVIAVDCYDDKGKPTASVCNVIHEVFKAVKSDPSSRSTGFIFSTALTASEAVSLLKEGGVSVQDFDALIVASGSEMYYPSAGGDESSASSATTEGVLQADPDYDQHISFRWGSNGLRKTLQKLITLEDSAHSVKGALVEDESRFNKHCFSYTVQDPPNAPSTDQIRQRLRMRGLRCHLIFCQNESRMNVIPLLASRSQALRYLFVRWGLEVSNMYVIVGETGDTDYEELLAGTHKTLVLKSVVSGGSERILRTRGSYHRIDVVPADSPNIITADFSADQISSSLEKLIKAS